MTQIIKKENFIINIKKDKRSKSPKLIVKPDCSVTLVVPFGISQAYCQEFIHCYESWIQEKLHYMKRQNVSIDSLLDAHEDEILFFGEWVPLQEGEENRIESRQIVYKSKNALRELLRGSLKTVIADKCRLHCENMGVQHGKIGIRKTKNRWGSCGRAGDLSFSLMLSFAPLSVIDYLCVHELSHIRHKNHADHFWKHVETYCPEYAESEHWIKENHRLLQRLTSLYL